MKIAPFILPEDPKLVRSTVAADALDAGKAVTTTPVANATKTHKNSFFILDPAIPVSSLTLSWIWDITFDMFSAHGFKMSIHGFHQSSLIRKKNLGKRGERIENHGSKTFFGSGPIAHLTPKME